MLQGHNQVAIIFLPCSHSQCQGYDSNLWSLYFESSVLPPCYCAQDNLLWFLFCTILSPGANGRIWTFDIRIMREEYYHCATETQLTWYKLFSIVCLPMLVEGFEPFILGFWVQCSTTMLPGHNQLYMIFCHFVSPNVIGRIRTLSVLPLCY